MQRCIVAPRWLENSALVDDLRLSLSVASSDSIRQQREEGKVRSKLQIEAILSVRAIMNSAELLDNPNRV